MGQTLNEQAQEKGFLVFVPLDKGHPFGNYLVISHHWTALKRDIYTQRRVLLLQAYSKTSTNQRCVVMRFHDLLQLKNRPYPLPMRPSYWGPLGGNQPFFIVGSTMFAEFLENKSRRPPPYLLVPSNFTRYARVKRKALPEDSHGHSGKGYVREVNVGILEGYWIRSV